MTFQFKTTPFSHQLETFERFGKKRAWGVLWDQGTGKTKLLLDTAAIMYEKGAIDAVLVIAPNGVHRNWINDEIPVHSPERIDYRVGYYESNKASPPTQKHTAMLKMLTHHRGLSILAMS